MLKRSLYGLKQSPRQWNLRFDQHMRSIRFLKLDYDKCVYLKKAKDESRIYLLMYMDDMLVARMDIQTDRTKAD